VETGQSRSWRFAWAAISSPANWPAATHQGTLFHMVGKRRKDEAQVRKPPDLLPCTDDLRLVTADAIVAGEPIEESHIVDLDLSGRKLRALNAKSSIFDGVSFAGCEIPSPRLRDVRLVKCDLSNATLRGFEATRVEFIDCRLIGMAAIECHWQDVLIENCDGRYARFNDGRVHTCEFRASNFTEADLRATDLEFTIFTHVILNRADLSRSKLRNTDLRGAEIDGIIVGPEDVRGAIVNAGQAMDFARLLGLVIK
jgi:uncharacterized protein YjbI with pentapeptide repeats